MKVKTNYSFMAIQRWPLALLGITFGILTLSYIDAQAVPFSTYGFSGSSGVFAASCSGPGDGGLPNGSIVDNRLFFKAGSNCTSNPLTSSASSSFTSGNVSASGETTVIFTPQTQEIHGITTMSSDAQDSVRFPAGFTDAGFIGMMDLQVPGLEGEIGIASVMIDVSATLSKSGPNVSPLLYLVVSSELAHNAALHQPIFKIRSPQTSLVVNETLFLDLPFMVGTPSQFLVRAMSRSMTSSARSRGNNTASVDFQSTLAWGGIDKVVVMGQERTVFTATDPVSGVDWTQHSSSASAAPVPEPSTMILLGSGLIGLVGLNYKRNKKT